MKEYMLHDSQINGIGKISGGSFNKVQIDGVGEITGDLTCHSFHCNGKGKVLGHVQAESIHINGLCKMLGSIRSRALHIDGNVTVEGGVYADQLDIRGGLSTEAGCEAERFRSQGRLDIRGLLNAESVTIELITKCHIRDIGGEEIVVRKGLHNQDVFGKMFSTVFGAPQLVVDTVEGDTIELECTNAKIVRGNDITIGPDCTIERIEYKGKLEVHERSRVGTHIRI